MQPNPVEEWQRLTAYYRELTEGQLLDLAADLADLTETAQQVLRDEIRHRGLEMPRSPGAIAKDQNSLPPPRWDTPVIPPDAEDAEQGTDIPHDYTWKTLLCECDEREEAWQIAEMLRRAGIESWIEGPGSSRSLDVTTPRVLVAADQLDRALEIAARPVPQDIIDQSKMEIPEFDSPRCPGCRTEDPILESVDPVNTWRCEVCGMEWSEQPPDLK